MKHLPIAGRADTMLMALLTWLCILPLVGLIVLPLFGLKVAGPTALGLLLLTLIACWLICIWPQDRT